MTYKAGNILHVRCLYLFQNYTQKTCNIMITAQHRHTQLNGRELKSRGEAAEEEHETNIASKIYSKLSSAF